MSLDQVEFNMIITFLGMLCATVQAVTGGYAAYIKKRVSLLKTNRTLFEAHCAFGSFATVLYILGLFAGLNGLVGAITRSNPPLELQSTSFNIHTWGSFPVLVIVAWKTYLSYFKKGLLYGRKKWLGIAMFVVWSFTWLSAATSYYVRTLPSNPQHPAPVFLLPYEWLGFQLALPFLLGVLLGGIVLRRAESAKMVCEKPVKPGSVRNRGRTK